MKYLLFSLTPYALLLTVLAGCGYHLSGSNRLPSDIETVAVPVFHNNTFEPTLENTVTAAVKQEFLTTSRLKVVNDPDQADLVVKGTIVSYGLTPFRSTAAGPWSWSTGFISGPRSRSKPPAHRRSSGKTPEWKRLQNISSTPTQPRTGWRRTTRSRRPASSLPKTSSTVSWRDSDAPPSRRAELS